MGNDFKGVNNSYVARIYKGKPGESLLIHCEMASECAKFLAKVDNRMLCWAIKTLSEKLPGREIEKKMETILAEITFIHDSGKHWKEWQDSLFKGKTRYLPHDVLSGLSLLDVSGSLVKKDKMKFLVSSEMDALDEINVFTREGRELIVSCKRDKSLALSIAIAIMSHHCCNVADLPNYLESVRERGQMGQLVKNIIVEWKKIFKVREPEGMAALSMLISTIVESDWYAVRRFEKLKQNKDASFKEGLWHDS